MHDWWTEFWLTSPFPAKDSSGAELWHAKISALRCGMCRGAVLCCFTISAYLCVATGVLVLDRPHRISWHTWPDDFITFSHSSVTQDKPSLPVFRLDTTLGYCLYRFITGLRATLRLLDIMSTRIELSPFTNAKCTVSSAHRHILAMLLMTCLVLPPNHPSLWQAG